MNLYDLYTDALEKVAKNVPTSPEKWARAKAQARARFDVYPSAYANGWAAKKYKAMGGGWKKEAELNKEALLPIVAKGLTALRGLMATNKAGTAIKAANTASNIATGVSAVKSVASAKPKPPPAPPSAG